MKPMMLKKYFGGDQYTYKIDRSSHGWQQPDVEYYRTKEFITGQKTSSIKRAKRYFRKSLKAAEKRQWLQECLDD